VLTANGVFIPKTVVLELERVLRYVADQPGDEVTKRLAHLITLPGVTVEDRDEIEAGLGLCRNGFDFADALHLAASKACTELLTFDDRGYARRARKLRLKRPRVAASGLRWKRAADFVSSQAGITRPRKPRVSAPISAQWSSGAK
jgi:predicted nucleic-acid-binding protein